jgi:hypothetical protein
LSLLELNNLEGIKGRIARTFKTTDKFRGYIPTFAQVKRILLLIKELSKASLKANQNILFIKETKPLLFFITLLSLIK